MGRFPAQSWSPTAFLPVSTRGHTRRQGLSGWPAPGSTPTAEPAGPGLDGAATGGVEAALARPPH